MSFDYRALFVALIFCSCVSAQQQNDNRRPQHFEKDLVSFNYPAGWQVGDGSAKGVQYFEITNSQKTAQIAVIVQRDPGLRCNAQVRFDQVTSALVERLGTQIHASKPSTASKFSINSQEATSIQLHGVANNRPVTASVARTIWKRFFINLVYLRTDEDAGSSSSAWTMVSSTFYLANPPTQEQEPPVQILNAKAVHLVQPEYPMVAKMAHASGTVTVEVEIDETGIVTEACAVSGHPLLIAASIAAAKKSRFSSPKLSGKTVGLIQYHFLAF
jgi:TonB family protein